MTISTMAIDPVRLCRAVHLNVDRMADGRFIVRGGELPHVFDPESGLCDCEDARFGSRCKHALRIALEQGDPDVVQALRLVVPVPGGHSLRGFTRTLRKRAEELTLRRKVLVARILVNIADEIERQFLGRDWAS